MYLFVSAKLRQRGKNTVWELQDAPGFLAKTLLTIFTDYLDGYLTLTNATIGPDPLYVDLNALRSLNTRLYNHDFSTWLGIVNADAKVLPLLSAEPVYTTTTCLSADAWQARYRINRAFPGDPLDTIGRPRSALRDLLLQKPNINYEELHDFALTTVNGFLHPNLPHNDGLVVRDGAASADVCLSNHVGLIGFVGVGRTTEYPITLGMISRPSTRINYRQTAYVKLGVDLTQKSVMVSLGGYLHINDDVYDIINYEEGIIKLNLEQIDLTARVFESRRYLNLDHLALTTSSAHAGALLVSELGSDEFVLRYLTMVQSFIIVVDSPCIHTTTKPLGKIPVIPNRYEVPYEPLWPMRGNTGRLLEYWARQEYEFWTMAVSDGHYREYLYQTTFANELEMASEVDLTPVGEKAPGVLWGIHSTVRS